LSFEIRPATRLAIVPILGFYGESGTGKTLSSLLLARGLVGSNGSITMIDTERRRGELYADVIPGGYDTLQLEAPFSPMRYCEAMDAVVQRGTDVMIIDSASHEWEGSGGVLDMAAENERRTGKDGLHNWQEPKRQHFLFMQRILASPIPVILCVRAKYKTRYGRDAAGKRTVVKDEYTSPIQSDDILFDLTAHAEILRDHTINLTKCSHPQLRDCFPVRKPITIATGEAVAAWAKQAPVAGAKAKGRFSDWLENLKISLGAAETLEAIEEIEQRPEVQIILDKGTEKQKQQTFDAIQQARMRVIEASREGPPDEPPEGEVDHAA
jgi:hypothetical protein